MKLAPPASSSSCAPFAWPRLVLLVALLSGCGDDGAGSPDAAADAAPAPADAAGDARADGPPPAADAGARDGAGTAAPAPDGGADVALPSRPAPDGGSRIRVGSADWQAEITFGAGRAGWCGGALIARTWVLTTAACVHERAPADLTVRVGLWDRSRAGDAQARAVSEVHLHPGFDARSRANDVALLKLAAPVRYGDRVSPISLDGSDLSEGTIATLSGWGGLGGGAPATGVRLQERRLAAHAACEAERGPTSGSYVLGSTLCAARAPDALEGCGADQGAPLVGPRAEGRQGVVLVGLLSWAAGPGCSGALAFTNVGAVARWVRTLAPREPLYADVDDDGCVDDEDLMALDRHIGKSVPPAEPRFDLDDNGVVDFLDFVLAIQNWSSGCPY